LRALSVLSLDSACFSTMREVEISSMSPDRCLAGLASAQLACSTIWE
jgi:hypothetical protein